MDKLRRPAPSALARYIIDHPDDLRRLAKHILRADYRGSLLPHDASDFADECIKRALSTEAVPAETLDHAPTEEGCRRWLYGILRNVARERYRSTIRERSFVETYPRRTLEQLADSTHGGAGWRLQPEVLAERRQQLHMVERILEHVDRALDRLGPDAHTLMALRRETSSWKEIAKQLKASEEAVRQRYSRLLKDLSREVYRSAKEDPSLATLPVESEDSFAPGLLRLLAAVRNVS
jgi:RNA polymerase sigma factor (sigma-70 family)